jgi:hypothetical protein
MFDDFRREASSGFEEEEEPKPEVVEPEEPIRYFLGITPPQRFFLAIILLFLTCILSAFCLLATAKVVPPIF